MGAAPLRAHDPAAWPGGGASAALDFSTRAAEAEFIAGACEQITTADPAASVGVISRAGWRRAAIDAALAQRPSIPCRHWDLAVEDPAVLDLIRSVVSGMPPGTRLDDARARVIAALDPGDVDTIEQVSDAITQLAQAAPGATARAALARFRERDHEGAVGPGVHLLNAHTGKGQQFDWVIACGLEEGHLPDKRNSTGDALDEEQRVLLVILSRARHGVIATRSSTQDGRFGPYPATPSRWWNALTAIRHAEPPGPGAAHERDLPAREHVARRPAGCRPRMHVPAGQAPHASRRRLRVVPGTATADRRGGA